jgi:hypothetical protein
MRPVLVPVVGAVLVIAVISGVLAAGGDGGRDPARDLAAVRLTRRVGKSGRH